MVTAVITVLYPTFKEFQLVYHIQIPVSNSSCHSIYPNSTLSNPTNAAPTGGIDGSQNPSDINLESLHISCINASSKDCAFGQCTNYFYSQPGDSCAAFQQLFRYTAHFYHDLPSIMIPGT
jgi:hypothetical protein